LLLVAVPENRVTVTERAIELFLRRLLLRSNLSSREQAAIRSLETRVVTVSARRDFVRPGEAVQHVSLVAEGLAARTDVMRDGSRAIPEFFIAGDMCDLPSLVAPRAGWGMMALSRLQLVQIPHQALRNLVRTYPEIGMAFWRDCTADAGTLAKWVGNIGRKDGMARIAHVLCEMGMRMEAAGLGTRNRYDLAITQEQLGDAMGLTPVHVNRTLSALREAGAVDFKAHVVDVFDWDQLTRIAGFDEQFLLLNQPENARLAV
jgi:CRP-like cAMP-binding protein